MGGISVLFLLGILMSMYFIFVVAVVLFVIYVLVDYVFESIFIYSILAKKNEKSMLAWIPFYNKCLLGTIANKKKTGIFLFIVDIILVVLIFISCLKLNISNAISTLIFVLIMVLIVSSFILNIVLSHSIIKKVTFKYVDLLTLLNVFTLGFSRPIVLFTIRKSTKLLGD